MKKLPIVILLSAAGITGVAMAQTSANTTTTGGANAPNTSAAEIGKDIDSYGQPAGASGSKVSGPKARGTNGGAYSTSGTNGAMGTSGAYGTSGTNGAADSRMGAGSQTRQSGATNGGTTSSTDIGKDLGSYGKPAGAAGSRVSPSYGKGANGASGTGMGGTSGAAGTSGMSSTPGAGGAINWTCPAGYTLSTATRDGTPLCYPSSGAMPGGR